MYAHTPDLIARAIADAGLELPTASADALAAIRALRAARDADPAERVTKATTAANAADQLDTLAAAMTAKQSAAAACIALEQPLARAFYDGLRAKADDLVKAMRPRFDKAAAVVHLAGKHFPPGTPKAGVLDAGDEAVSAYRKLDDALNELGKLRSVRVTLADLCGHPEQAVEWYVERIKDGNDMERAQRAFTRAGNAFHNLAAEGFRLRLNTLSEAATVAQGAALADQQRRQAEQEATAKELRESMPWLASA